MSSLVEFKNVSKTFTVDSKNVTALENVSLSIEDGDILAIIGYSGAGKSTLVRLINGLEKATSGSISVLGEDITTMNEKQLQKLRPDIGMIFQQFNLFEARTTEKNIAFPLELAGWSKDKIAARVAELLSFVGLERYGKNYPSQLSGGQKQRVGIARALATSPKILLADESTSALDPETTQDILKLLKEVNETFGITIVVITHEMDVVKEVADKVIVMEQGKVLEQGSVYDVFSAPQEPSTQKFVATVMNSVPDAEEIQQIQAQHPGTLVQMNIPDGYALGPVLTKLSTDFKVNADIVHGGISTLKGKRVGSITLALNGNNVEQAIAEIQKTTQAEVIAS